MLYLFAICPTLLYLLILKMLDGFALAKRKFLIGNIIYGFMCCMAVLGLSLLLRWQSPYISPVLEELLKAVFVLSMLLRKKIHFLAETLIYGAAAGGGFSIAENIIYILYNPDMLAGTIIMRGIGVAVMHMGCTALVATVFMLVWKSSQRLLWILPCYLPSIFIHIIHNTVEADPTIRLICTLVLFFAIFFMLFNIGDKMVYRWIDSSISSDIETLSAIRRGEFSTTNAGRYMLRMKEQFRSDVFFDMLCYMQLHYELIIEKQSRMLMQQAGFDSKRTAEEQKEHDAKVAEIKSLRRSIGRTAQAVIAPLVKW
ncbi:MAG: PrsW family glutamic-type intramembrane protease [Prevotellaceae bacterium]|nr:PrsW family glutamic-type intramembrane protease [Prevotellaceae bacterium]